MIWAIGFYWVVCALAWLSLSRDERRVDGLDLVIALLLGGFILPARAIAKVLR